MRQLDEKPYIEILGGWVLPKVSPKRRHAMVQGALFAILRQLARDRGDVGTEWRCMLARSPKKTTLVPDVAFVSRERLAPLDEEARELPPFAPDIAIEVRSPSDKVKFRVSKIRAYLDHGSTVVLDVHPRTRIIRAFTRDGVREFHEDDRFECAALPWFSFDVREAFADLDAH